MLILRKMPLEHHAKGKMLNMCFVDLEKAFGRVTRKVLEWALRKKGIPEVSVRSMMSLHQGAKTKVKVDTELSEEFEVKVGMHQRSVLSNSLLLWLLLLARLINHQVDVFCDFSRRIPKRFYCQCGRL